MFVVLAIIGSLFYIGWRINKRYQEEGLGRAVASVVLLVVGILLCIFLGPVGLGLGGIVYWVSNWIGKNL